MIEPTGDALDPASIGDVDDDGKIDTIFPEGLPRSRSAAYDTWQNLTIPDYGCGC